MKATKLMTVLTLSGLVLSYSCKRTETVVPEEVAGKGGNASITATPRHHSLYIDSCTIYIKYNTNDKPNLVFNATQYDDAIKCTPVNGLPTATFEGLKKGKYYVYGVGYDTVKKVKVEEGRPVTIIADQNYSVIVPVTEGD